jgi:hypothetical protein
MNIRFILFYFNFQQLMKKNLLWRLHYFSIILIQYYKLVNYKNYKYFKNNTIQNFLIWKIMSYILSPENYDR